MSITLDYYNENARAYYDKTIGADFADMQQKFLNLLPEGAKVLDFGCGSGRDAAAFAKAGCTVKAIDGSKELCKLASEHKGIEVECMDFRDFSETEKYDGIWACASLLHIKRVELPDVICRLGKALRENGILYLNFKYGDFEGNRDDRYYTDMTESSLAELVGEINCFTNTETWITEDVLPGREGQKWLNVIFKKEMNNF